jgi:hypothetical protein
MSRMGKAFRTPPAIRAAHMRDLSALFTLRSALTIAFRRGSHSFGGQE